MKIIIFLLLTTTALWSYQNATFTIKGTVIDPVFEGTNVYLQEKTDDGLQTLDTLDTTIVQNGTFSFTGIADENALRYIVLSEQSWNHIPILFEQGTINVTFGDVITVSGTRINTLFSEFRTEQIKISERMMSIVQRFNEKHVAGTLTDELEDEIRAEHTRINEDMQNLTIRFVRNNIENEAGKFALRNSINSFEPEMQEELLALTDNDFRAEHRTHYYPYRKRSKCGYWKKIC